MSWTCKTQICKMQRKKKSAEILLDFDCGPSGYDVQSDSFVQYKDVRTNHQRSPRNYHIHRNSLLLQLLVKHALNSHMTSNYCPNTMNSVYRWEVGCDPCNDRGNEGAGLWSHSISHLWGRILDDLSYRTDIWRWWCLGGVGGVMAAAVDGTAVDVYL